MLENAVSKAGILAKAAGMKLGEILSIDYSWGKLNVDSQTRYTCEVTVMSANMDIEPEDVETNDAVTVVWTTKE